MTLAADCIGILCILFWGWWLCRALRLPGGFGPILGVCLVMVWMQAVGGWWPGAVALLAGAAYTATRGHRQDFARYLVSPGVLGFLAGLVLLELAFALRAPRFQTWDEFSHWGVFFKNLFYGRRFAIWEPGRSLEHQTYPQGGAALYGLFALLRRTYAERDVFLAMDVPLLAAGSALFAVVKPAGRIPCTLYRLAAAAAVPLMLALFGPDTPYTTVYMDAAVGAVFAAGLALLAVPVPPDAERARGWAVGLLAAGAAALKEIGGLFALCLLGIWLAQSLLAVLPQYGRGHAAGAGRLGGRLAARILPAAGLTGASILLWKLTLLFLHRTDDQFAGMGPGAFFRCWQEARSGADPYFYSVWQVFYTKVRTAPLLFGWSTFKLGLVCALLGLGLAALAWRLGGKGRGGVIALIPLLMTLFFPLYLFVLFYVYIGGMSPYEAMKAASYERYACCWFIGWFGALAAVALALAPMLPRPRWQTALSLGVAALLAANGLLPLFQTGLADSFSLPPEGWRDEELATADALRAALGGTDANIWLLSADADLAYQNMWYYHYELYPLRVDIETASSEEGVDLGYNLAEHSIGYLVLFGATDAFAAQYGSWFADGLAAARQSGGAPAVYAAAAGADGAWRLSPVG